MENMSCLWWPSRKIHTQNHEMSTDPDPHNKFWMVILFSALFSDRNLLAILLKFGAQIPF